MINCQHMLKFTVAGHTVFPGRLSHTQTEEEEERKTARVRAKARVITHTLSSSGFSLMIKRLLECMQTNTYHCISHGDILYNYRHIKSKQVGIGVLFFIIIMINIPPSMHASFFSINPIQGRRGDWTLSQLSCGQRQDAPFIIIFNTPPSQQYLKQY